jgi:hypothetical protein
MKAVAAIPAVAFILASCAPYTQIAPDRSALEAEIATRQGKEVDRICFASQINGWRELSRDSILVEKGVNDWYQLDLSGTCEPDNAFDAIAVRTRPAGSPCLTKGDSIQTFDAPIKGSCFIRSIHEWDDKAEVAGAADD